MAPAWDWWRCPQWSQQDHSLHWLKEQNIGMFVKSIFSKHAGKFRCAASLSEVIQLFSAIKIQGKTFFI